MSTLNASLFLKQIETCYAIVKANVGEITHEESLIQPKPAGNCLNWVLGHLVATRSHFLQGINGRPVWNDEECKRYDRHGAPMTDPRQATQLAEIWQAYDLSQERLRQAVSALTPEQVAAKSAFSPGNDPNETIGSLLIVFAFHDSYHTGQTGVLRRLVGRPPKDL